MAHMNQAKKKELAPQIKTVLNKYGIKGSIGVRHHSTLVVNLWSGPIDFWADFTDPESAARVGHHFQVNEYHYKSSYKGRSRAFLSELIPAMNGSGSAIANHDRSDIMTDYFDVGWYIDVNVGTWEKHYAITK